MNFKMKSPDRKMSTPRPLSEGSCVSMQPLNNSPVSFWYTTYWPFRGLILLKKANDENTIYVVHQTADLLLLKISFTQQPFIDDVTKQAGCVDEASGRKVSRFGGDGPHLSVNIETSTRHFAVAFHLHVHEHDDV